MSAHPGRKPVYGSYASYSIQILQECATVAQVIAWVQEHQWHEAMHDQLHFADAGGDAVVISAGPDGKVAFTRKPAGDGYLVSTNFNLADRTNGAWPCWRYERARELLHEIDSADELTAERAASVLDAVHVASPSGFTILSVLGDLPHGLVYVYLFYQFDAPIVLDVAGEIAGAAENGRATAPRPLRDLFPPETVNRVDRAYQRLMARPVRCDAASWAWLGLVVVSLLALVLLARPRGRALAFWSGVVAVLGPVGLLAWGIAARPRRARGRQSRALVEVVGDLIPSVVGMVAALLVLVRVPTWSRNPLLQLFAFYGIPLSFGLLLYQTPLLAWATKRGYLRTLWDRLPAVLVSTHLAMAGLFVLEVPLIKWHLETCGFGAWTVLSWWAIAAAGACAGGLLLYAYHTWTVRRGYRAWSALLWGAGEADGRRVGVASPPWRRLWVWVVGSFVVLAAGIVLGLIGSMQIAG